MGTLTCALGGITAPACSLCIWAEILLLSSVPLLTEVGRLAETEYQQKPVKRRRSPSVSLAAPGPWKKGREVYAHWRQESGLLTEASARKHQAFVTSSQHYHHNPSPGGPSGRFLSTAVLSTLSPAVCRPQKSFHQLSWKDSSCSSRASSGPQSGCFLECQPKGRGTSARPLPERRRGQRCFSV